MDFISEYLPLLLPVLALQLALIVFALFDLVRREQTRGPKWLWVLIIIFINFFGPIIYFVLGRDEV